MRAYSYRNVIQRISDIAGNLIDVSSNLPRIKRLIYQAAIQSVSAMTIPLKTGVAVEIMNGVGELPCDLIRLLRAYDAMEGTGDRTLRPYDPRNLKFGNKYQHDGMYIKPNWKRQGKVYIDYYAMPTITVTDESGNECQEISISSHQLDYCAYEVVRTLLREEFALGKINGQVYQLFDEEAQGHFHRAMGNVKMMSIDDFESLAWFSRNSQFFNLK